MRLLAALACIELCCAFVLTTPVSMSLAAASRASAVALKEESSVSPIQGVVLAGGALGIVGAAFCTSTGSPPTGLAVATTALLFMFVGANLLEGSVD